MRFEIVQSVCISGKDGAEHEVPEIAASRKEKAVVREQEAGLFREVVINSLRNVGNIVWLEEIKRRVIAADAGGGQVKRRQAQDHYRGPCTVRKQPAQAEQPV